MTEDFDDPRHIYQARMRQVAREAERDFAKSIGLYERPRSIFPALVKALNAGRDHAPLCVDQPGHPHDNECECWCHDEGDR